MKKTVYPLSFFFFICAACLVAQGTFEVHYEEYLENDRTKFENKFSGASMEIVNLNWEISNQKLYFELVTRDGYSKYKQLPRINNNLSYGNFGDVTFSNNSTILYKDLNSNKSYLEYPSDEELLVQDSLFRFDWKIDSTRYRTILGYKCFHASTIGADGVSKVEAWYSPEIEISDGPYLFFGLPGLILEVSVFFNSTSEDDFTTSAHYIATKVNSNVDERKFEEFPKHEIISIKDYEKRQSDLQDKYNSWDSQGVDTSD